MRAITKIQIQKEGTQFIMFLNYNNDANDYSFNPYQSVEECLDNLPVNDPYFPIKTNQYRFLEIKGNKTLQDKLVNF
jgi:hypothetical protein